MIDIDKWGPPPPVTDNVNHGDLLKSLNALGFKIQQENALYTTVPALTLAEVKAKVAAFGPYAKNLIEAHTSKRGVTHRETKKTVALEKKDNFRMATMEECVSLANVNAFVSPAGGKAALSGLSFDLTKRFQQNDIYPIAAISNQPLFKHTAAYSTHLSAVLRGPGMIGRFKDNLIMSPRQSGNSNNIFSLYKGFKSDAGVNNRYYDTGGVKYGLKGNPENPTIYEEIGASAAGRVVVLDTPNRPHTGPVKTSIGTAPPVTASLNGLAGGFSTQDGNNHYRDLYIDTANPGFAGAKSMAYIWQRYYGVVPDGGSAITRTVTRNWTGPNSGDMFGRVDQDYLGIKIGSICKSNAPNVTLEFESYFVSSCWEVIDKSYILKLQGVICHTNTGTGKKLYFNFSMAFRGVITQATSGLSPRIVFSPVYHYSPTVLVESDLNSFNSGFTRLFEKGSVLDTFAHPGSIIEGGLYVRQQTYPQHSYVHYTRFVDIATPLDYFKTPINALDGYWVNTIPVSHIGMAPWGNTAQRIIPVEYGAGGFKVLSYAMDNSNGGWTWAELSWVEPDQPKPRTSFKAPDKGVRLNTSKPIPPSISSFVTRAGVSYQGLNFVECNRYTGSVGLTYANGSFSETGKVVLNSVYLTNLLKQETAFLARAKAYYGNTGVEKHQEFTVGVFTLGKNGLTTKDQALVVMTDGFGYMELAISNYTIANGVYNVATAVESLTRYVVTPLPKPTLFTGEVSKVDTYRVLSTFSDMSVYEYDTGVTMLSFNRPWGDHRIGKVTVCLENYNPTTLTMSVSRINAQPTKLVGASTSLGVPLTDADWNTPNQTSYIAYPVVNSMPLETFDVCTPTLGFMCNKGTRPNHSRLGQHITINPSKTDGVAYDFDSIQQGDLVVPSGYPVVLSGRAMKTYRDMGFNSNNNGVGWHHYLKRDGLNLELESTIFKELEPRSDYIEIGGYSDITGNVVLFDNELTISGLKMSYARKGSSFPISLFSDPTDDKLYGFFHSNDAPHYPPRYEVNLPTAKTLYATELGTFTVDIFSRVPPIKLDWYVKAPNGAVTKLADKVVATAIGNNVYRSTLNHAFPHWNETNSKIYCESFDVRPRSTLSNECVMNITIPIFNFAVNNVTTKAIAYNGQASYTVTMNAQVGVRSYQWYQRVGSVTTQVGSSNSVTITGQRTPQSGSTVWCVVTDNTGQVLTSVVCTNTVAAPIFRFTTNLSPTKAINYNTTAMYEVAVESEAGILKYEWFKRLGGVTTPIGNNSESVALLGQKTANNGTEVWVKVTDSEGNVITSVTSRLTVNAPIFQFTTNNVATKAVTNGDPATYSVVVQSDAGVKQYVWYQKLSNGNVSEVGNTASITLNNQGTAQSGSEVYCVVIDNENNQITSVRCVQTVSAPILEFTSNIPASVNLVYAGIYAFSVAVNAQAGVQSYEWYQRSADGTVVLESRTAKNYIPRQTTRDDKSTRWCVVTDNVGQKITSTICTINVAAPIFSFTTNLPATKTVDSNSSAVFSVGVKSQAGIQSYQWWRVMGGVPAVVGTNSNSLTLNNQVTANDGSQIYCVVTDIEGNQITSVVCTLEVRLPTLEFRTNNVATKKIMEGGTTNLSVVVNSQVGVSRYQWYLRKGGTTTSVGDNDRVLTILSAPYEWNGGELFVVVTDNTGQQITSNACVLTVIKAILEFTAQPANTTVAWDGTANFSTTVNSNIGSLVYVWKLNGAVVGGNSNTLSLPNRRVNGTVVVEVTDGFKNKITSNAATITVNSAALSFTSNIPTTKTLGYYEDASFTVAVNAQAGVASYTWYRKQGANTSVVGSQATLTLIDQNASNTGSTVWCEVTDNEGSKITSVVCTLTVAMPYITTDLVTPIYHHVSPNAKTFSIVIQPYAGVPEFTWWIIPYGTSTPIQIANGITSDGTSSTLQYVMDNVQDMIERVFCKVTFPADATATLQSTTSVIYLSTPLKFSLNLPATRTTTRPGVEKTFNVAVIGGTGNPTYSWYTQWTNASGVEDSAKYAGGSPSLTFMLQGGAGSSYKVWVRVQDPIMGDVITSNQQVIALANPITLTHQMPSEMWGDKDGTTEVFVSVLDTNGPYTFTWTSDEPGLEINSVNGRHASMVRFKKAEGFVRFNLNLKVTDKDGGASVFSSVINTYTVYRTSGEFDPMPPKINIIGPNSSGPALVTAVTGGGVATPLIFDYFRSDGTSQSYEAEQKFHVRPYVNSGVPGTANKYTVEVYDTGSQGGVLSSHLFVTLDVDSPANGWGLGPVAPGTDHDYAVLIPQNIGRPPMATFLYYTDVTVPFYKRKTIQFGYKVSMIPGQLVAASQLPPEVRTKTLEIYGGAIDADGRWWVTPVTTVLPSGSSVDWTGRDIVGTTVGQTATWTFAFRPDGGWGWAGNGTGYTQGNWSTALGASSSGYSIKANTVSSGGAIDTNITTVYQKIDVNRLFQLSANFPPRGEPNNWKFHRTMVDIRNDQTGKVVSAQLSIECYSERR